MAERQTQHVALYVDPACPWAWLTSRWLLEVERVRPVEVETRVFSLAEVNRDENAPKASHAAGLQALRVLVKARRAGGETAIRSVYTEIGEAYHERDEPLDDVHALERAVAVAGLDPALVRAALDDDGVLEEVLSEHAAAVDRGAFGVATLSLDGGPPYFGPVVDTRITGEPAGELWDIVVALLAHPRVFELKRGRTTPPDVGRYRKRAAEAAG